MVDIWLIVAQIIPFFEVLLHTFMDTLRTEEGEGREVNHHGKAITVGGPGGAEEQQENKLALQHKESDINISHKSLDGQATSDVLTGC